MVWRWRQKWKQATKKMEDAASETCRDAVEGKREGT